MTQFSVEPPPVNSCSFCGRPIGANYWRVNGRPACEPCMRRLAQLAELNEFKFGPWMLGLIYGLAAAILCGFGWAVIVKITHAEIGIIAIGIGIVVTKAILAGCRMVGRGTSIQAVSHWLVVLLGDCFIGEGLRSCSQKWVFWEQIPSDPNLHSAIRCRMSGRTVCLHYAPIATFRVFDLIWYGFAAVQKRAWRMTAAIKMWIEPPRPAPPAMVNGEIVLEPYIPPSQQAPAPSATAPPLSYAPPFVTREPRNTPLPRALMISLASAARSCRVRLCE